MISVTNSDKGSFTMKFSTRDRYALRLMVELANRPNDLIPLKDISDKQRISLKYLEQIVTPLAKAGLVSSVRGAQGGYRLARSEGLCPFTVTHSFPVPPAPRASSAAAPA